MAVVPDPDEQRRFEEIVAPLRPRRTPRSRGRLSLVAGIALCLAALLLITLGGVRGAVIAVVPWFLGLILVIRSKSWR